MDSSAGGRVNEDARLDCRGCGVDLLKGEWRAGVCRRCVMSVERLIKSTVYVSGFTPRRTL